MIANIATDGGKLSVDLTPEEERKAAIVEAALVRREHRYNDPRPRKHWNGTPWPAGRWDHEPDVVEWRKEGFACLVTRNFSFGNFCGYLGVGRGHPWHGIDYNEVGADVHGGLTYEGDDDWSFLKEKHDVEIVVDDPGLYWLGFDCGHAGDYQPGLGSVPSMNNGNYRTVEYTVEETERLVRQAGEALREHHLRR